MQKRAATAAAGAEGRQATVEEVAQLEFQAPKVFRRLSKSERVQRSHGIVDVILPARRGGGIEHRLQGVGSSRTAFSFVPISMARPRLIEQSCVLRYGRHIADATTCRFLTN
jgi:hypothetical protein